jgi:hypothetical protein
MTLTFAPTILALDNASIHQLIAMTKMHVQRMTVLAEFVRTQLLTVMTSINALLMLA